MPAFKACGRQRLSTLTDLALCLAIVAVFIVNLLPLQLAGSFEEGVAELIAGLGFRLDDQLSVSLVQRLIVYLPLGLLAYGVIALRRRPAAFVGAVLIVALVGLAVETLQAFLSKRHPFSTDFLLVLFVGVVSALLGAIVSGFLARRRMALLQLLLFGNIFTLTSIWLAHRGSDLASWDCGYPLIIGNEATADRPWLGKLRGFAIYPRALDDEEVGALTQGFGGSASIDRRRLGAALIRSFGEGQELSTKGPAPIEATRDASHLCEAIKANEAFTIEIELASLDLDQRGPARILTMSLDPEKRNVTLAQDGSRLSLRIRNEFNGENGIEHQIRTTDNTISGGWQHWVARYDRGITTLFLDGDILKPSLDYESILLVSGRRSLPLAAISGLMSLILGAAAYGWLEGRVRRTRRRLLASAAIALAPQAATAVVIALTSHRLPASSVSLAIVTATLVGILAAWYLGRSFSWFQNAGDSLAER